MKSRQKLIGSGCSGLRSILGAAIEGGFQLDEWPRGKPVKAEKGHQQVIIDMKHRAHAENILGPEECLDRLDQLRADTELAELGVHGNRVDPPRCGRAELPGAYGADDIARHL